MGIEYYLLNETKGEYLRLGKQREVSPDWFKKINCLRCDGEGLELPFINYNYQFPSEQLREFLEKNPTDKFFIYADHLVRHDVTESFLNEGYKEVDCWSNYDKENA